MKTSRVLFITFMLLTALALSGCASRKSDDATPAGNAVYYWRTVFKLSESERDFLKNNDIKRIYTRFFDVENKNGRWLPESTLIFTDSLPEGVEIVPTVFIDSKALALNDDVARLAPLILARVDSMMSKNGYPLSEEIEIDFDWTARNRDRYFSLLNQIKDSLNSKGRRLSTTIRLHQLSQTPPAADYGVLMAYNMGNFKNPKEGNSIISIAKLKEYLPKLKTYPLALRCALPIYSWNLLFRDGEFVAIARDLNLSDTTSFRRLDGNHYEALKYMPLSVGSSGGSPSGRIYPGDKIRAERSEIATLDSALKLIERQRPEMRNGLILYHLDETCLKQYNRNEIENLYSGN